MKSSKLFIWLLAAALVACTKMDKDPDGVNGRQDGDSMATFRVDSLEGDGATASLIPGVDPETGAKKVSNWAIPHQVNFRMTACLSDRSTRAAAAGHRFEVEIPSSKKRFADLKPTTTKGCFTWMEPLPFTYFVEKSKWIVLERDIIGTGVHTGRQRVRIAVNPWAVGEGARDRGDEVRFLRDKPLPDEMLIQPDKADIALAGAKDSRGRDLMGEDKIFVDDVQVQTIRRGEADKGMLLRLKVSMEPKVQFANHAGIPAMKRILNGDFIVIAHLVLNNTNTNADEQKQRRVILTSPDDHSQLKTPNLKLGSQNVPGVKGFGRVIDGKLVANVDAWIEPRMAQGNLELVIKLIPTAPGLSDFEGIYELGAMRHLSSSFSGTLNQKCRDEGKCSVAEYLSRASNFKELRAKNLADDNSPYLFDRMKLRFVQVQPGETTTERTVEYSASTCVIDAFTGDRPIGLAFNIRYLTPKNDGSYELIENKKTEEDGCLNWSSTIYHKYYWPEQFYEQKVSIEKMNDECAPNQDPKTCARKPAVKREMTFFINPWDDKFTFGFDHREFKPEFWEKLKVRRKIPSRFFLANYGYHTVRFQYNIDSLMNLEVRKTVLMELDPRVLRYSGIVNARKMTEPMRDGIWLMKVAIQKNYLDPASTDASIGVLRDNQAQIKLKSEKPETASKNSLTRLRKLGIVAPEREFISTQTALVRSTDGVIIQPVEMKMRDLRLMRVRSNFLIELQAVNEKVLQAENQGHREFQEDMKRLFKERVEKNEKLGKAVESEDGKREIEEYEAEIRRRLEERRKSVKTIFSFLADYLQTSKSNEIPIDQFSLDGVNKDIVNDYLKKLNVELQANDFTNIKLPSCASIDCDKFIQKDPGLKRRTFVGPVIFLSNGYSDSIRATDNLDEARCPSRTVKLDANGNEIDNDDDESSFEDQEHGRDAFETEMRGMERDLFSEANTKAAAERQNTIYRYSEYFGSLSHLCHKHVDRLIQREKQLESDYQRTTKVVSSVYNFANAYHLDFLSLTDERPKRFDPDAESKGYCAADIEGCMLATNEFRVPVQKALGYIARGFDYSNTWWRSVRNLFGGLDNSIYSGQWNAEELRRSVFETTSKAQKRFVGCALLSANMADNLKARGVRFFGKTVDQLEEHIMNTCMSNAAEPVRFDRKLRVFKTGQDGDSYVFLGGYQMNINVGQSFSVNRSDSWSWSSSFEAVDWIGPMASKALGNAAGMIAKPFSLKVGNSSSMSNSEGTSIGESTYLVSQIAKFRVRLDEYERCAVISFTPKFLKVLELVGALGYSAEQYGPLRALFVCEGVHNTTPKYVDETYFYFTQHFTEGDMLDQADLYNHPWLLALRGYRDYGAFISLIRAQEVVSFWNFAEGIFDPKTRSIDWPLAHMKEAYRQITPSYPGYYTELDATEGLTQFPLEKRLRMTDPDMNNEVTSRDRKAASGRAR